MWRPPPKFHDDPDIPLTLCYYGLRDGEIRCLKNQPAIDDHDDELAQAA